jgi:5-methylcytosine-specific restriction enzyme A
MPHRAKQICRVPGCGALCDGGYCDKHSRQAAPRLYDQARGSPSKRGYGRRHQRWRTMILARDPLCRIAVLCDGTALSTEADHILPLAQGGTWAMTNGQGACKACHSHKTALEQRAVAGARDSREG